MKNSNVLKGYLILSGMLLTFIGGSTLFMPVIMKASAGIDIVGNINILNDVRASAALILGAAILMVLGAFASRLTFTSSLISFVLFLSLGIGRVISIVLDGMPVDGLIKATGLEFVLGIIGVILFIKNQEKK